MQMEQDTLGQALSMEDPPSIPTSEDPVPMSLVSADSTGWIITTSMGQSLFTGI